MAVSLILENLNLSKRSHYTIKTVYCKGVMIMKVFSVKPRKDGKYTVKLGFDTGRRFTKICTKEQADDYIAESRDLEPHKTAFER